MFIYSPVDRPAFFAAPRVETYLDVFMRFLLGTRVDRVVNTPRGGDAFQMGSIAARGGRVLLTRSQRFQKRFLTKITDMSVYVRVTEFSSVSFQRRIITRRSNTRDVNARK